MKKTGLKKAGKRGVVVKEDKGAVKEEPKKEEEPKVKEAPKKEAPKKEAKKEVKKEAAKDEGSKDEAKKGVAKKDDVSPEISKEKLAKEALEEIAKGIESPTYQKVGICFVPLEWGQKYKPVLGAYKRFVQAHPEAFAVMEHANGGWSVVKAGDKAALVGQQTPDKKWQDAVLSAWQLYCAATPKADRDTGAFTAVLPQVQAKKEAPAEAKKEAPAKEAAPAAKPAAGEGAQGVKRKAQDDGPAAAGAAVSRKKKKVKKGAA